MLALANKENLKLLVYSFKVLKVPQSHGLVELPFRTFFFLFD